MELKVILHIRNIKKDAQTLSSSFIPMAFLIPPRGSEHRTLPSRPIRASWNKKGEFGHDQSFLTFCQPSHLGGSVEKGLCILDVATVLLLMASLNLRR